MWQKYFLTEENIILQIIPLVMSELNKATS